MTKLDNLIAARGSLEDQLQAWECLHLHDAVMNRTMEHCRLQIQALRWAERICRAALVVNEERTPDGVSDTIIDELCKATRS